MWRNPGDRADPVGKRPGLRTPRTATLTAAKDLYGATSAEYATVATPWTAATVA
ncbi:hypothetical protein [Kitasatospora sp. NPDC098663]|uniref:hypothetical protein n=1 Tax=Kitasatospora sp. NPDC098663 TaxID=3364096 RepID=UPI0037FFECC9